MTSDLKRCVLTKAEQSYGQLMHVDLASQVRLACSPDKEAYMIILEPDTCQYVCVLYHPSVCQVEGMGLGGQLEELQHDNGLLDHRGGYDEL